MEEMGKELQKGMSTRGFDPLTCGLWANPTEGLLDERHYKADFGPNRTLRLPEWTW